MRERNKIEFFVGVLILIGVLMIGLGIGYDWGIRKVNQCKNMTIDEFFESKECKQFYVRGE